MPFNVVILPRKASENVLVSFQSRQRVGELRKKQAGRGEGKPDCKWKENHANFTLMGLKITAA
ncbi:hypothetical protein BBL07_16150 [Agrobacterium vitis]|nr:hypothetical protein BBL07_16150 [Agrobacterium vitis]